MNELHAPHQVSGKHLILILLVVLSALGAGGCSRVIKNQISVSPFGLVARSLMLPPLQAAHKGFGTGLDLAFELLELAGGGVEPGGELVGERVVATGGGCDR